MRVPRDLTYHHHAEEQCSFYHLRNGYINVVDFYFKLYLRTQVLLPIT